MSTKLNTYIFNNTETLKQFVGVFNAYGLDYMLKGPFALMDTYEGTVKVKEYRIFAENEEGFPYVVTMKAVDETKAKEYWKQFYPNDIFDKIELDTRKGMVY